jgi:hypothetical protein
MAWSVNWRSAHNFYFEIGFSMQNKHFSATLAAWVSVVIFTATAPALADFVVIPPSTVNPAQGNTTPGLVPGVVFFNPIPYLSRDDIPEGFYLGDQPTFLDDLEDGSLNGGLFSPGIIGGCLVTSTNGCGGLSVDEDDGAIDGNAFGFALIQAGASSVSVASGPLPTAFGLAITSGNPFATAVSFTAFDGQGTKLGSVVFNGSVFFNTPNTTRARFVGVQYAGGIQRVEIDAGPSIAFDHIQYGTMAAAIPEPESYAMMLAGLGLIGLVARRRNASRV